MIYLTKVLIFYRYHWILLLQESCNFGRIPPTSNYQGRQWSSDLRWYFLLVLFGSPIKLFFHAVFVVLVRVLCLQWCPAAACPSLFFYCAWSLGFWFGFVPYCVFWWRAEDAVFTLQIRFWTICNGRFRFLRS